MNVTPVFKDERKRAFLNAEGADRPLKSPVPHETLLRARRYRIGRIRQLLAENDCAAILLYDSVNIRYAFGQFEHGRLDCTQSGPLRPDLR